MSKESKRKAPQSAGDDDMDVGMEEMDGFFSNVSRQVEESAPASEPTPTKKPVARPAKAKKKKSLLTRKQGIYLSEKLDDRLDEEWRNQERISRKSKSMIVENILRAYWKLPPIEE